jgi:hypothetical protein
MQNRRIAASTTIEPRQGLRMQGYTAGAVLRRAVCWWRAHLGDVRQSGPAGVSRGGTVRFIVERRTFNNMNQPYLSGWAFTTKGLDELFITYSITSLQPVVMLSYISSRKTYDYVITSSLVLLHRHF